MVNFMVKNTLLRFFVLNTQNIELGFLPGISRDGNSRDFPLNSPSRFPGKNTVFPGNSRPAYQVNWLRIGGSKWKYKVAKLR